MRARTGKVGGWWSMVVMVMGYANISTTKSTSKIVQQISFVGCRISDSDSSGDVIAAGGWKTTVNKPKSELGSQHRSAQQRWKYNEQKNRVQAASSLDKYTLLTLARRKQGVRQPSQARPSHSFSNISPQKVRPSCGRSAKVDQLTTSAF